MHDLNALFNEIGLKLNRGVCFLIEALECFNNFTLGNFLWSETLEKGVKLLNTYKLYFLLFIVKKF